MNNSIALFILAQFVNVVLGTMKYIATVKFPPFIASQVTAISCTVGSAVTYFLVKQDIMIVLFTVYLTNTIGVPIGQWLINKFQKDRLWIYDATIRTTDEDISKLRTNLKDGFGIHSTWFPIVENNLYQMKLYVYTKDESRIVKRELARYDCHYNINEAVNH